MMTHTSSSGLPVDASVTVPLKRVIPSASAGIGVRVGLGLPAAVGIAVALGVAAGEVQAAINRPIASVTASAR